MLCSLLLMRFKISQFHFACIVASGIPPFRGTENAVWSESVQVWGTKHKFLQSPAKWYEHFYNKHFAEELFKDKEPNSGHVAVKELCDRFPETVNVITQNIDKLHSHETVPIKASQLIEIHGAVGTYKCFTDDCLYTNDLAYLPVEGSQDPTDSGCNTELFPYSQYPTHSLPYKKRRLGQQEASARQQPALFLDKYPYCPGCKEPMCPNTLLFDEQYSDHETYQFDTAQEWLEQTDAIVFVGTSFSVSITDIALDILKENNPNQDKKVFNFNIENNLSTIKSHYLDSYFVQGKCEETLAQLYKAVKK